MKGKSNIKRLSKVLGHRMQAEQFQCTLALILQVSGSRPEGLAPFLQRIIPHSVCRLKHGPESPVGVQSGLDLVTAKAIKCSIVILEETCPTRTEMFPDGMEVIALDDLHALPTKGSSGPRPCQQNAPHSITEPRDPLSVRVKHSGLCCWCTPHMLAHLERIW